MEAINFVKQIHKPFIGYIDENITDEDGFNYYDLVLKYCFLDNEYICDDCFNKFNKVKKHIYKDLDEPDCNCSICGSFIEAHYFYDKNMLDIFYAKSGIEMIEKIIAAMNEYKALIRYRKVAIKEIIDDKPKEKQEAAKILKMMTSLLSEFYDNIDTKAILDYLLESKE